MSERANYITCPKGHKVFVIWSPIRRKFGFTCDECDEHSDVAMSFETDRIIKIKVVGRIPKRSEA